MAKKIDKKILESKLPAKVAEKYKVVTIRPARYNFNGFGEIDLRTISLNKADELFEKEFPFLKLIKKAETDSTTKTNKPANENVGKGAS